MWGYLNRKAGRCILVLSSVAWLVGSAEIARASREVRCDDQIWICGMTNTATIGGGTELPGQSPTIESSGIVWVSPDGILNELIKTRPDGEDAIAVSYSIAGELKQLANTNAGPDLLTDYVSGIDNTVTYAGSNDDLMMQMTYLLPDAHPTAGVIIITTELTNTGHDVIESLEFSRSFNPNFQVDIAPSEDALVMSRPLASAVVATHPLGGMSMLLGTLEPAVASVEGDLVIDPSEVLLSPRDPLGAIEDTSLALATSFGDLGPGDTVSLTMYIVAAADPEQAMQAFFNVALPGDGNGDGWVDGLDYLLWAENFGENPSQPIGAGGGDFNGDQSTDGLDYLLWASQFGAHAAVVPVPEPSSFLLAFSGCLALVRRRRCLHRKSSPPDGGRTIPIFD